MNMKKIAQAFRLLADAMEETAERFEDVPAAVVEKAKPEPKPAPTPEPKPAPTPEPKPAPTMTQQEFTTAMQAMGREVGPSKLHAALPAVWEKYTDGVARMSAIPADRYAEIVQFTREEVERLL